MRVQTSSAGSVQAFAAHDLPRIVRALGRGAGRVRVAQRLGSAVSRTLGLPTVELAMIGNHGEGLAFAVANQVAEPPDDVFRSPSGTVVLRTAFRDDDQGAYLAPILRAALDLVELGPEVAQPSVEPSLDDRIARLPEPTTLDRPFEDIYHQAQSIAAGEIGVLIRGASGCGKEVLAQFVHRASPRAGRVFLALNCAALPRDLLESELFGVERGVATGVEPRPGMFERAHGGTLFLDEIGDMAPETQAKILRVMQEGEVSRLGGSRPRPAQARILAATNRDLESMIDQGLFRRDLFHRLSDWQVTLPTLVERRVDIINLAAFFLDRETVRLGLRTGGVTRDAARRLVEHPWPGNVRQLERQMVRAALFLEDGEPLSLGHLRGLAEPVGALSESGLEAHLEGVERRAIERALALTGGDVGRAAERLEVGRSTLYRRVKHLGIAVGE